MLPPFSPLLASNLQFYFSATSPSSRVMAADGASCDGNGAVCVYCLHISSISCVWEELIWQVSSYPLVLYANGGICGWHTELIKGYISPSSSTKPPGAPSFLKDTIEPSVFETPHMVLLVGWSPKPVIQHLPSKKKSDPFMSDLTAVCAWADNYTLSTCSIRYPMKNYSWVILSQWGLEGTNSGTLNKWRGLKG